MVMKHKVRFLSCSSGSEAGGHFASGSLLPSAGNPAQ